MSEPFKGVVGAWFRGEEYAMKIAFLFPFTKSHIWNRAYSKV